MPKISVIIPLSNNELFLPKALDSLIHQTSEDFEVIIVDDGSTDSSAETAKKFCEEYVDFFYIRQEKAGVSAAINRGIEAATGEYVIINYPDDYIIDGTVEAVIATAESTKADIINMRKWDFGEKVTPGFDMYADVLVLIPELDRFERSTVWNLTCRNRAFRRAFLLAQKLSFTDSPYADMLFCFYAFMRAKKITGTSAAVYEQQIFTNDSGFRDDEKPTAENLKELLCAADEMCATAREEILKHSGSFDGDESYIQELRYFLICRMIDSFYTYFWFLDETFFELFVPEYKERVQGLVKEKITALQARYRHLCLPFVYSAVKDAALEPSFSLLFDVTNPEDYAAVINSLYIQSCPFFELFVKQSAFDSPLFPEDKKQMPNLTVLPDAGFFSAARAKAKSKVCINVKDGKYLNRDVLKQSYLAQVPLFLKPLIFSHKRNNLAIKKNLKEKGLDIM